MVRFARCGRPSTVSAILVGAVLLAGGCDTPAPPDTPTLPETVFSCRLMLIGLDDGACTEDVVGPGELSIAFAPDPLQSSWEVGIRGLAALAEACEFHGSYDQTRLSALQGRGETEIVCAIDRSVDRQYHEIRFEGHDETPNTTLGITVTFTKPAA